MADDWEIPDIKAMMQTVDVVLAASPPSMDFAHASGAQRVAALGGGVDYRAFLGRPRAGSSPFHDVLRPFVGYAGGFSARIDFPLLKRVATDLDGTLVLVGPILDETGRAGLADLLSLRNVIWVGHKDEDEAQECVANLDVGLIPYAKVRHTLGCNPAKLYEYLAAGLPIVATDLPLLRHFADVIGVATDADSFAGLVQSAIREGRRPEEVHRRREVAASHSYEAVVDLLMEQVSRVKSGLELVPPERAWRFSSD